MRFLSDNVTAYDTAQSSGTIAMSFTPSEVSGLRKICLHIALTIAASIVVLALVDDEGLLAKIMSFFAIIVFTTTGVAYLFSDYLDEYFMPFIAFGIAILAGTILGLLITYLLT